MDYQRLETRDPDQVRKVKVVTWAGMIINIVLSGFKIAAGIVGSSQTIVADGFHSLSDTITDLAVIVGVDYWCAPPDENHPHGHRRIETVITLLIGIALAAVALGISYEALTTLHEEHMRPPGLIALIAALVSIVAKELIYQWTIHVGKEIRSSAVVANAWHHRSDALSSIPAAVAVAVAWLFPDWSFVDHVGAILVSLFILQAAWSIIWPAVKELTDYGAPPKACREIEDISLSTPGVNSIHKVRTRQSGYGYQVDLHIQVDPAITVRKGHNISKLVKQRLLEQGPNVIDVMVHLEPKAEEPG